MKNYKNKIAIIGSGFSSLSAACYLAKEGHEVVMFEKNDSPGGRARKFKADGFTFDMGPSWYWMPDVFDRFFKSFGKKTSDYYKLIRLDPSYKIYWGKDDVWDIPAKWNELENFFEKHEKGSASQLNAFMAEAAYKYEVGINDLVYKPSLSLTEFLDLRLIKGIFKLDVFASFSKHAKRFFKHPKLIELIEFPVLFLGATPENTPALYSLMNYADMKLGTWYPKGGMFEIVDAMVKLAIELGVKIHYNAEVKGFEYTNRKISAVNVNGQQYQFDYVVAGADYHHIDQIVLNKDKSNYDSNYWDKRVMAPSSIIYYLGINKKLNNLLHHNLFFDTDFKIHAKEIYDDPKWPNNPLFYVSCPSVTDNSVAPVNHENLFILIPVAPGLQDTDEIKNKYFDLVINRLENLTKQDIRKHIVYKKAYAHSNFIADYHSFKGNAYGLANTLKQTAILKPSIKNKHIDNLYFTGQLTVPGPGVPPSIISGEVVANQINKKIKV
jgi:phytoene desaturase